MKLKVKLSGFTATAADYDPQEGIYFNLKIEPQENEDGSLTYRFSATSSTGEPIRLCADDEGGRYVSDPDKPLHFAKVQ